MSNLKKLAGQTAVYGLSSILGRSINFLLIIVYTAYLDTESLGAFTGIYALIGFLNIVFTYGMETAFFRFSTGKNQDPAKVYKSTQSLLILSTLVLGTGVYLLAPWLAEVMDYPGKAYLFRWTALILSFDAILAIPFAKLRLDNKALDFAGAKLINILLNVLLNLFFIVWLPELSQNNSWDLSAFGIQDNWGVEYILLSNLLANGLIIPYVWWRAGFFSFGLEKDLLKPMWNYSLPLLFMGLAGVTNELVSRLLFEYVLPENYYSGLSSREAAGVFGANFKLAILMNLVIQAFKYAAEPFFFRESQDKNSPFLYARVMHAFIIFCSLLMIAISVNLYWIGPMFLKGEVYAAAFFIVPILLMGYLLLGVYFNLSIWFKLTDQTKYSFWITFIGALISIAVIVGLVPIWGYLGGALSTLACYLTMTLLCFYWGQKFYPIPYKVGRDIFYLLLGFGLSYVGFFVEMDNWMINFLVKNIPLLLFTGLIFYLEKEEFSRFIRSRRR